MANDDIQLEITFGEIVKTDPDLVQRVIDEAAASLPVAVETADVRQSEREQPGAMGLAMLPVLEILVSGGVINLLISEISKLFESKLNTESEITVTRTFPDGRKEKITIKTNELTGKETLEALGIATAG